MGSNNEINDLLYDPNDDDDRLYDKKKDNGQASEDPVDKGNPTVRGRTLMTVVNKKYDCPGRDDPNQLTHICIRTLLLLEPFRELSYMTTKIG